MSQSLSFRAPTRLDLGGGWTDVPPYCQQEGGFVCNIAIARYATATVSEGKYTESPNALIHAAVRRSSLSDVVVAIDNDFPVGAGLGGSSSASAAVLGALRSWRGIDLDLREIAEEGRVIEVEDLGVAGGRQDHYAATHGGALGLRFSDQVEVERIALSASTREALEERALVIYTGESRISGETITAVLDAYHGRNRDVINALARMKDLAEQMAGELRAGDIDDLGAMIDEHWVFQRALHPAIPTPLIDEIITRARKAGAIGAKALGASGGGCVLVLTQRDNAGTVRRAIEQLGTMLPFAIDVSGLTNA